MKVKLIFSSCRSTHVGGRWENQLWQREEIVLQHRELHPLQVIKKHYSSVLGQDMSRQGLFNPWIAPRWTTSVRCLTDLNEDMNEEQRSGRLWCTTINLLSVSAELNHHVFATWSRCPTDSVTTTRQQQQCLPKTCMFLLESPEVAVSVSKMMSMLHIPPYGGRWEAHEMDGNVINTLGPFYDFMKNG